MDARLSGRLSEWTARLRVGAGLVEWRQLAMRGGRCPVCGRTLFVRLAADPLGARCLRCAGWPASLALARVVRDLAPELGRLRAYEASSRGPLAELLQREAAACTLSEYWDDVAPGALRDGVVCQDLEALRFADASFDLCTSTEVLEHVADDAAAFAELRRVLAPGGWLAFTVPLFDREQTIERAVREPGGRIRHLLPPSHHDDRLRGRGQVLVFRDYGRDIVSRLARAGFVDAAIREPADPTGFGHRPRVVVARRPLDAPTRG